MLHFSYRVDGVCTNFSILNVSENTNNDFFKIQGDLAMFGTRFVPNTTDVLIAINSEMKLNLEKKEETIASRT